MTSGDQYGKQHITLDAIVFDAATRGQALTDLRRYFRTDGLARDLFTGRRFESFAGGGDAEPVCNQVTSADVLALSLLGIERKLGRFALDVLETHIEEINKLLAGIPLKPIYEVSATDYPAVLGAGSPAWELWGLLCECGGKNRTVSAYKLLARKRPHLLPVYDRVVRDELDCPDNVWACIWSWFHSRPDRVMAVRELRDEVDGIQHVSLLRCLDVALWMRGKAAGSPDQGDQELDE